MSQTPADLTRAALDAALKAGADAADAVALDGTAIAIDVRDGRLEQAERSEGRDLGLRVFVGQRVASVSTSDTRPETLALLAERAVAMAREAPEDEYVGLAEPSQLARNWDLATLELADPSTEPSPAELEDDARTCESSALAVKGISQVQSASAHYSAQNVAIAATNGFEGAYSRTSRSRSCVAVAGEGLKMERDYDGDSRTFQSDLRDASEIGRIAAERALERLNPKRPKTGAYPVLFDERVSSSLIGHLTAAMSGSAIARGSSWLLNALGEQVLPASMSLTEAPHRPRAGASRPFDGEGLPTRPRTLVDNGTLTGWTLDLTNARKLGMQSTANAARGTSGGIGPACWNLELTQGTASREDLIQQMGTGLLVTSMIGSTINPNTGDYSRGAAGWWIENGVAVYPVSGVTIAGNLRDMLKTLIPANDARPWLSRVVPSLLVEGLTLAGD